jgi:hypothetical protein
MKRKMKNFAALLFSVALIACNSSPKEVEDSKSESEELTSNDTTIVIASGEGSNLAFVADSTTLRNDWQNFMSHQPDVDNCQLNHIALSYNSESGKYFLITSGTLNSEDMRAMIELRDGGGGCLMLSGWTLTCTATGQCANDPEGCLPAGSFCTKCTLPGTCTKSISDSPTAIFSSIETGGCNN